MIDRGTREYLQEEYIFKVEAFMERRQRLVDAKARISREQWHLFDVDELRLRSDLSRIENLRTLLITVEVPAPPLR